MRVSRSMKQALQLQHAGAAATVLAPKQEHKLYFQLLQELSSTVRGRGTKLPQEHQGRQRFGGRGAARPVHTGGHRPPTAPSHTSSMQWCISLSMVSSTGPGAAAKPRVKLQRRTAQHDAVRVLTTQRLWPDERGAFPFALLFRRVRAVEWASVPTCRAV